MTADATLDSELFVLFDRWPGTATPPPPNVPYLNMVSAMVGHNQTTAIWPIGTKWVVENHFVTAGTGGAMPGFSTFVYLRLMNTDGPTPVAKQFVVPKSATNWWEVTNDPDSCLAVSMGLAAVMTSVMTDTYYGWFWCGGICPEEYVSGLGGNYATNGDVIYDMLIASNLTADAIGLSPVTGDTTAPIGYCLKATD